MKILIWLRVLAALGAVVLAGIILTGCAAAVVGAAAGAGGVLYSKGELKSTERGTVQEVYRATLNAMDDMKLETVEKTADSLNGKVLAKESNGDNVNISMEQKPNNLTELKIRVGAFGDETKARVVLDHIRQQLGK